MNQPRDKGLNGNEKIEQAVAALQQEPTQEQLAHTFTVIRRRIKEHGQLVVAVEPNLGSEQMQLRGRRHPHRSAQTSASVGADIRIGRRRHLHRSMRIILGIESVQPWNIRW